MRSPLSDEERFWSKVNKTEYCWEWTGRLDSYGYGQISIDGKEVLVHRFSYALVHGAQPSSVHVLHHCDNRKCIRPDHLFPGNQQINVRDAMEKKRMRVQRACNLGETHPNAKLTTVQVDEVRRIWRNREMFRREIAAKFEVSLSCIESIIYGKSRKAG